MTEEQHDAQTLGVRLRADDGLDRMRPVKRPDSHWVKAVYATLIVGAVICLALSVYARLITGAFRGRV